MRLPAIALATVLASPAFAQEVRVPHAPPPEGFYRDIDGVYDLLARPYAFSDIQMVRTPRLPRFLEQLAEPQSGSAIDWTRPVVGVDSPPDITPGEKALSVEVDVKPSRGASSKSVEEFVTSLSIPPPPPCEPAPTANAPAAKPAGPAPCPATR